MASDMVARFDHVLVDEYQDTNRLQASIFLALKPTARALQLWATMHSRFTRSEPRGSEHSGLSCCISPLRRDVTLDRNYRSTDAILGQPTL